MNHFICPYCGKQLDNQAMWISTPENANEFWCDDCNKIFYVEENTGKVLIEEDNSCIVEESI